MPTPIERAYAYIKAGDIEKAKPLLAEILKQNPGYENAWVLMSWCVTDAEQKKYCLERVLKINPQNQHAIEGLRHINYPMPLKPPPQPRAKVVPQQPVKKKGLSTREAIVVVGVGLVLVLCCAVPFLSSMMPVSRNTPAPTEDYSGGSSSAYLMCQQFLEKRLVAPATAVFPKKSDIQTFTVKDKKDAYQIRGYVDSQNRMGALLRLYYVCEVSYIGSDNWHLDYLEFDE